MFSAQEMPDRFLPLSCCQKPVACLAMQKGYIACFPGFKMMIQQFGKQRVVSIPAALFILGNEKKVLLCQPVQKLPTVIPTGYSFTQGRRQPWQKGGFQQEVLNRLGLPG